MADYEINPNKDDMPYHKRIAMGAKLDGQSMQPKGEVKTERRSESKSTSRGALSQANKK